MKVLITLISLIILIIPSKGIAQSQEYFHTPLRLVKDTISIVNHKITLMRPEKAHFNTLDNMDLSRPESMLLWNDKDIMPDSTVIMLFDWQGDINSVYEFPIINNPIIYINIIKRDDGGILEELQTKTAYYFRGRIRQLNILSIGMSLKNKDMVRKIFESIKIE